jgi:hypothetical protein
MDSYQCFKRVSRAQGRTYSHPEWPANIASGARECRTGKRWRVRIQKSNLTRSIQETIDIGELVDRAIEARHGSQQAGITPQIEQLPIFGIHKEVFLALRYRLPDNQACLIPSQPHQFSTDLDPRLAACNFGYSPPRIALI